MSDVLPVPEATESSDAQLRTLGEQLRDIQNGCKLDMSAVLAMGAVIATLLAASDGSLDEKAMPFIAAASSIVCGLRLMLYKGLRLEKPVRIGMQQLLKDKPSSSRRLVAEEFGVLWRDVPRDA